MARDIETLGQAVNDGLAESYDLVYVDYRDELPDSFIPIIVRGEEVWEAKDADSLTEWESSQRWDNACDAVDEVAKDIVRAWEREDDADYDDLLDNEWPASDERQSAIETVQERDNSDWFTTLVKRTGSVLLRVPIGTMTEDDGLSFSEVSVDSFLARLGFDSTPENVELAREILAEVEPEISVAIGYALIGVDLEAIYDMPNEGGHVELRNPHVWLGNPFSGSGWCAGPFTGTLTVKRDDLRTDRDAFGYSWDEIVGGASASQYEGDVTYVPAPETTKEV